MATNIKGAVILIEDAIASALLGMSIAGFVNTDTTFAIIALAISLFILIANRFAEARTNAEIEMNDYFRLLQYIVLIVAGYVFYEDIIGLF
ncbi:MAG: hypothetical protein INQ03_10605 [Candidatus Heimdallarchaeota archaeon]|nr:hypothetical protein [Candidatus Heimdallarchaeota archaeon]